MTPEPTEPTEPNPPKASTPGTAGTGTTAGKAGNASNTDSAQNNHPTFNMPISKEEEASLIPLLRSITAGHINDHKSLHKAKLDLARSASLVTFPTNAQLLALGRRLLLDGGLLHDAEKEANGEQVDGELALTRLERVLRSKPMRTLAGVAPVAIMTQPAPCPHGTCIYCPGGVEAKAGPASVEGPWEATGTPQSYTGHEPAARRGARHNYDPSAQVSSRLEQYRINGHPCDKVDLIVMGGTFTCRPLAEQLGFIIGAFRAFNGPGGEEATDGKTSSNMGSQGDLDSLWEALREAHALNESAPHRVIGLTLETRPDQCSKEQVGQMVELGTTRVELGVQVLDDAVLANVGRAHTVQDIARATANLKEAGLKVGYHLMPGLPGMDPDTDVADFQRLWDDPGFRPDMLKLYPTLVMEGTQLAERWRAGEYAPYDNATATDVVARMKATIPPYVRVQRIQRDIPAHSILAGTTAGNLRQLARNALAERGAGCDCIRCAEAGLKGLSQDGRGELTAGPEDPARSEADGSLSTYHELEYGSAGGREMFLTYRQKDGTLLAYCRLRLEDELAMVRELKVVGQALSLEDIPQTTASQGVRAQLQHRGLGRQLMAKAERRALQAGARQMRVTSGVGVRPYYRRMGYELEQGYMVKDLSNPG